MNNCDDQAKWFFLLNPGIQTRPRPLLICGLARARTPIYERFSAESIQQAQGCSFVAEAITRRVCHLKCLVRIPSGIPLSTRLRVKRVVSPLLFAVTIWLIAFAVSAKPSYTKDPSEFTQHVLEIAQGEFPTLKLEKSEQPLSLKMQGSGKLSLANLYKVIHDEVSTGEENFEIRRFLGSITELSESSVKHDTKWETVKERIRPQIFPKDFLTDKKTRVQIIGKPLPFSKDLLEGYVIDSENTFQYVTKDHLNTWRTTTDKLREVAYGNLGKASGQLDMTPQKASGANPAGHYITITLKDGYAAARILLPDVKKKLQSELGHPCFVAIPNRDFLVAWSDDFSYADEFIKQVRKDYRSRHHPLSPIVFKLDGSNLVPEAIVPVAP